jgi:hypothetical protein
LSEIRNSSAETELSFADSSDAQEEALLNLKRDKVPVQGND